MSRIDRIRFGRAPCQKGTPMTLSMLFRSALLYGGEAITPALGTAEKLLCEGQQNAAALACKGALLAMLACDRRTGNRATYAQTAIALMDEALHLGDPQDAVLRWTVGMGLAGLPADWGQALRAAELLGGALDDPALMRWQRLFGLTMVSGLYGPDHDAARRAYDRAKAIDPEAAPRLLALFVERRDRCEARP